MDTDANNDINVIAADVHVMCYLHVHTGNVHGMSGGMGGGGLDELLERDDITLEEILSHDDVIQECKYMNTQLIE